MPMAPLSVVSAATGRMPALNAWMEQMFTILESTALETLHSLSVRPGNQEGASIKRVRLAKEVSEAAVAEVG